MFNRIRPVVAAMLLALLTGCFQAQLNGPVAGAAITVTDLRNPANIHAQVQVDTRDKLVLAHGQETWEDFGPVARLWLLGVFLLDLEHLQDDALYLVTASGGEDTDRDRDGREDTSYTPVAGSWRAIMSGAQLKSAGPKVSALTEAAYQWLSADLGLLTDYQVMYNLDMAATAMVTDVDREEGVTGSDLLHWSRLFDRDKLLADTDTLNLISEALVAGDAGGDLPALSRELVGRAVDLDAPLGASPTEELARQLAGLPPDEFFAESWRALMLRSPESIVELGLVERYGLEGVDLDNISDPYEQLTFDLAQVILDELQTWDRAALSTADQLSLDVYQWYLQNMIEGAKYQLFSYPASSFITGVPSQTQFFFSDIHPLETEQDARDYLTRLRAVDTRFEQLRDKVSRRAEAGIIEPAITMDWALDSLRQVSRTRASSTDYYRRFDTALDSIATLTETEREDLRASARTVVEVEIQPAYEALVSDLETLRVIAPQAIGFGQFEGGSDFYAYALRHRSTTDMTATEIHELGLRELDRVHAEIRAAAAALGYSSGLSLSDLFDRIAVDGGVRNSGDIIDTYEGILDLAYQKLPQAFDILPQQELVVIGDSSGGFYVGGSEDGSRPGAFYAANVGQEAYFIMPSLAYHEGVPGHHLQIALASEQELPDFRRYTTYNAFVEGWALYAERLAHELGWYADDPYGNLGRLQFEAIRAARLAVDTGIHDRGWSWDQAVNFYRSNTGSSLYFSQGSIGRFMRWPGQATSYMIGMNKLLELRAQMQAQQGDAFDLRQFHNLLLTGAAMPLDILEEVVQRALQE